MDIKAYITSGILEDYCLGVLSDAESVQVQKMAAVYPEIKKEIKAFQNPVRRSIKYF